MFPASRPLCIEHAALRPCNTKYRLMKNTSFLAISRAGHPVFLTSLGENHFFNNLIRTVAG
jgi:hypothetical protein